LQVLAVKSEIAENTLTLGGKMRLLLVFFVLFVALQGLAQQGSSKQNAGGLTSASFSASGLHNEALLTNLYIGNFKGIDFDRTNVLFEGLFSDYLKAYGSHCDAYLPKNKVEIKETYCEQQEYDYDRYGNRGGAKGCLIYGTRGTGIYADPTLYAAKEQLDSVAGPEMIHQAFNTMAGKNGDGMSSLLGALKTLGASQTITSDMDSLVEMNACPSPGLKRFQENLMLFALGKQPIVLPGVAPPVPSRPQPALPGTATPGTSSRPAPTPAEPPRSPEARPLATTGTPARGSATAAPPPSLPAAGQQIQAAPANRVAAQPATPATPAAAAVPPAPAAPVLTPEQQRQQRAAEIQKRAQKFTACRQTYQQGLKDHQQDLKDHPEVVTELLKEYTACIQAK
jgi:hypothetical protein